MASHIYIFSASYKRKRQNYVNEIGLKAKRWVEEILILAFYFSTLTSCAVTKEIKEIVRSVNETKQIAQALYGTYEVINDRNNSTFAITKVVFTEVNGKPTIFFRDNTPGNQILFAESLSNCFSARFKDFPAFTCDFEYPILFRDPAACIQQRYRDSIYSGPLSLCNFYYGQDLWHSPFAHYPRSHKLKRAGFTFSFVDNLLITEKEVMPLQIENSYYLKVEGWEPTLHLVLKKVAN